MSGKIKIIVLAILASAVLAIGFGAYINSSLPTGSNNLNEAAKESYYCLACGREANREEDSIQRPLAVIIENHPDARPQSGLADACIVYEVVAEGGITRFLAIFLHEKSDYLGPVRSVRDYFSEMAKGFEAIIAHCGGSPAGYQSIRDLNLDDLDEFTNGGAYVRSSKRARPHNLYTSTDDLRARAAIKGFDDRASFYPFSFKDDAPLDQRPESMKALINFSSPQFLVEYDYNRIANTYLRSMGRKAHRDSNSGEQLEVKNILIQVTPIKVVDEVGRVKVNNVGRGLAFVLLDGQVTVGKWVRNSLRDEIRFFNNEGAEIELNRGQIWIETIPSEDLIQFDLVKKAKGE